MTINEQNTELKRRIAQLGLECKSSILNLLSINETDQLDADHDQFDQIKQPNCTEDGNLDCRQVANFSIISLEPQSSLRILIRENRTVDELLFRMYFRDEISKQF